MKLSDQLMSDDIGLRSGVNTPANIMRAGVDLGTSAIKIINPVTMEKHGILSIAGEFPSEEPPGSVGLKRGAVNTIAYETEGR